MIFNLSKLFSRDKKDLSDDLDNEIFDGLKELQTLRTRGTLFTRMALPLVRRTFSTILAKEITSVQPMHLPSNLVTVFSSSYVVSTPAKKSQ